MSAALVAGSWRTGSRRDSSVLLQQRREAVHLGEARARSRRSAPGSRATDVEMFCSWLASVSNTACDALTSAAQVVRVAPQLGHQQRRSGG